MVSATILRTHPIVLPPSLGFLIESSLVEPQVRTSKLLPSGQASRPPPVRVGLCLSTLHLHSSEVSSLVSTARMNARHPAKDGLD